MPAGAQLGQAQVGGELPAAVPDRSPGPCRIACECDRVAGDLARITAAVPDPHQDTGVPQVGEELLLAGRSSRRGVDGPAERDPGRFGSAVAAGLLLLRASRTTSRGSVGWRGAAETEALLRRLAGLPDPVEVVPVARTCSVLAGQHGHDVDVIRPVPDRDPADRLVVLLVGRQAGAVHDVAGQPSPLGVGQHPVPRRGPDHAMPDGLSEPARAQRGVRLIEKPVQPTEVPMPVGPQRRLQLSRVPPSGDQVRIGVLLAPPGPEEVVQQSRDGTPAEHLPDHRRRRRTFSAAASSRSARRMLSAAYGRRSAER